MIWIVLLVEELLCVGVVYLGVVRCDARLDSMEDLWGMRDEIGELDANVELLQPVRRKNRVYIIWYVPLYVGRHGWDINSGLQLQEPQAQATTREINVSIEKRIQFIMAYYFETLPKCIEWGDYVLLDT